MLTSPPCGAKPDLQDSVTHDSIDVYFLFQHILGCGSHIFMVNPLEPLNVPILSSIGTFLEAGLDQVAQAHESSCEPSFESIEYSISGSAPHIFSPGRLFALLNPCPWDSIQPLF